MIKNLNIAFLENTRFIELNSHNYEILNYICTKVDSSYRNNFNPDNNISAWHKIKNYSYDLDWLQSREIVYEVCETIDRENSTHLAVSGFYGRIGNNPNPKNACGIAQMTDYIVGYKGLLGRIKNGDGSVVNDLAKAVTWEKGTISKFSFASKFCTYVSRYQFDDDQYCIYDNIIQAVLPYYIYVYCDSGLALQYLRGNRSIVHRFRDGYDYNGYRNLVDSVIDASPLKNSNNPRQKIDLLLWYYYKGDVDLIKEAICAIPR